MSHQFQGTRQGRIRGAQPGQNLPIRPSVVRKEAGEVCNQVHDVYSNTGMRGHAVHDLSGDARVHKEAPLGGGAVRRSGEIYRWRSPSFVVASLFVLVLHVFFGFVGGSLDGLPSKALT